MNRTDWTWRTVDIVVAAAIAIAFGVVFWAWNQVWAAATPAFVAVPPAQNILYGVWLVPAVLAGLIIRKPGAALFTELVAASVSAILGSQWGLDAVVSGALQGLGAEIVFLVVGYRRWTIAVALIAATGTAIAAWVHDTPLYYADIGLGPQLVILAFMVVSAIVIAGVGSWLLLRSLVQTGVLAQFPAGRAQQRV
ncbi:MAG TPA: ECF transporter S component [Candidatus Limnocylindria bacterium]|jgi:energy-coupling factor transport system substrate-specific component